MEIFSSNPNNKLNINKMKKINPSSLFNRDRESYISIYKAFETVSLNMEIYSIFGIFFSSNLVTH